MLDWTNHAKTVMTTYWCLRGSSKMCRLVCRRNSLRKLLPSPRSMRNLRGPWTKFSRLFYKNVPRSRKPLRFWGSVSGRLSPCTVGPRRMMKIKLWNIFFLSILYSSVKLKWGSSGRVRSSRLLGSLNLFFDINVFLLSLQSIK